jgi:hypothetical protein
MSTALESRGEAQGSPETLDDTCFSMFFHSTFHISVRNSVYDTCSVSVLVVACLPASLDTARPQYFTPRLCSLFALEDWVLLMLRVEFHLMAHSFKKDSGEGDKLQSCNC